MSESLPRPSAALDASAAPARRFSAQLVWPLATVLFLVGALGAWGLSSPVGSSPDDDFHLASIWCGAGLRDGICEAGQTDATRVVPRDLAQSICYAFVPDRTADCQGPDFGTNPETVETARGNFAGLYPPGYYFVMSWFVGPSIEQSVLLMRAVNVAVAGFALLCLVVAARPRSRQRVLWTFLAGIVPLGMFIIPSINPSSWAIVGVATATLAMLEFIGTDVRWQRWANAVIAGGATLLACSARGDAGVFIAVASVTVLIGARAEWRQRLALLGLPLALAFTGIGAFLLTGQSAVAGSGLTDDASLAAASTLSTPQLLVANMVRLPSLLAGVFGTWNLGWLDTPLPGSVSVLALIGAIAIAFTALGRVRGWILAAVATASAALVAFPMYVLAKTHALVGSSVQPRYLLPVMLIVLALLLSSRKTLRFTLAQVIIVVGSLAVANSLALYANLKRYIQGANAAGFSLNTNIAWWWDSGPAPMTLWMLGSLSFAAAVASAALLLWSRRRKPGRDSRSLQQVA